MKKIIFFILLIIIAFVGVSFTFYTELKQEPLTESINRGKTVYTVSCQSCHQPNGEGFSGVFPPLAGSDHLKPDNSTYLINVILKGQNEKITVNGTDYSVPMTSLAHLSDREIADVLNYIGNSWGNAFKTITEEQVKTQRSIEP